MYRIFAAMWKRFVRPGAQNSAKPRIGITPVIEQTLGGSDITWLVENGLAAINIGVGMQEVHGCKEHILFEDMISTTEILLRVLTT